MKRILTTATLIVLSGQAHAHDGPQHSEHHATPPPGSNEKLRSPIASADGLEVLISDVVIPPNATVPRHYHPGEEFLYVISGSAVHVQDGQDDIELTAGDSYVIPPRAVHSPRGGPDGARAVVFRVHRDGMPERILLEDGETPPPEEDEG